MKKMIAALLLLSISISVNADSMWSCTGTAKVKRIYPSKFTQKIQASFNVELSDDGTMMSDNHITSPVGGIFQLSSSRKKAYIYPDMSDVADSVYEANPSISDFQVISYTTTMKFNKPIETATKATHRSYVFEQFYNEYNTLIQVKIRAVSKCIRTSW